MLYIGDINTFTVLLALLILLLALAQFFRSKDRKRAISPTNEKRDGVRPPGPRAWPVLGSLPLLAFFPNPWEGFSSLCLRYGDIFAIQLGARRCVVVNSPKAIREVLVTKAGDFGGRPDFERYHVLFGGDRENSLALCEWTPLQKFRRRLAHSCLLPRAGSSEFERLEKVILYEHKHFLQALNEHNTEKISLKTLLLRMTANIFFQYLCSSRFPYDHKPFQRIVKNYDLIFYDINQGYLLDFLPWLAPVHFRYFSTIRKYAKEIRKFIETEIVEKHQKTFDPKYPRDFVDTFLLKLAKNDRSEFTLETALFELEDLVGGHPGVANLCMKALGHIAQSEEVQNRIFTEIKTVLELSNDQAWIRLKERNRMPFTESVVLETLRLTSSPIVPHVATTESYIDEWKIDKGTIIIFNNYRLNMDKKFWKEPESFNPGRFLNADGIIVKPDHFFPFSTGRRTCLGYRMVQSILFLTIANLVQRFRLSLSPQDEFIFRSVKPGSLALPLNTFSVTLRQR